MPTLYQTLGSKLPKYGSPERTAMATAAGVGAGYTGTAQQNASIVSYLGNKAPAVTPPVQTVTPPPLPPPTPTLAPLAPQSEYSIAMAAEIARQKDKMNQPVDENAIRSDVLANFQGEIDAQNALYASKLARAQVAGQGRLGSDGAIQSRRGLLGSDFGAAQTTEVNQGNQDVYAGIDAEKAAAISNIFSKVKTDTASRLAEKNAAKEAGAEAYLKFLGEQDKYRQNDAVTRAKLLVAQGIDPKNLTPEEMAGLTKGGVSADAIKLAYGSEAKAQQDAADKKAAEVAKTIKAGQTLIPKDSTLVDALGKVIATGKVSAPKAPKTISVSKSLINQGDQKLSATRGKDGYVDPNAYQTAFTDWVNGTSTHAPIGTVKEFLSNFPPKNYVNPANTNLPAYLMPTGKAKKSESETITRARF